MNTPPPVAAAPRQARHDLLLVALVGAILFIPFLGRRDLWTSGEARVAQVARQMRFGQGVRDWIIPHVGNSIRLKKPPLAYWLVAVTSLPFADVDEFNSRLPNALAGIGAMALVYLLAVRLYGRRAGLLSALALGTTGVFWWQARTTGIEMPLLFFDVLALYAWWRYREAGAASGSRWLLLAYAALGFAFLEKGPVGPLLVLLIAWGYLGVSGGWRPRLRPAALGLAAGVALFCFLPLVPWSLLQENAIRGIIAALWLWGVLAVAGTWPAGGPRLSHHLGGILLMLAIVLPWGLLILHVLPNAWEIWTHESAGRFQGFDHLGHPPYYFVLKALGDGQPWVLVALIMPWMFRAQSRESRSRLLFPLVWAVITLIFFSLPASKKSYYVLPIYPSLALMAGLVLAGATQAETGVALRKALRGFLLGVGALLCLVGLAAALALLADAVGHIPIRAMISSHTQINEAYQQHWPYLLVGVALLLSMGAGLFHAAWRQEIQRAVVIIILGTVCYFLIHTALLPDLNCHKADKSVCLYLRPQLQPGDRVYTFGISGLPIVTFYLSRKADTQHVDRLYGYDEVLEALETNAGKGKKYFLTKTRDQQRLLATFVVRARVAHTPAAEQQAAQILQQAQQRIATRKRLKWFGPGKSPGKAAARAASADAADRISAAWGVIRVAGVRGPDKKWILPSEQEARALVSQTLQGLPVRIECLGERLQRMDHPDMPNNAVWLQQRPLPFNYTPALNGRRNP